MKAIFNTIKTIVILGAICIGASYAYAQVGSGMPLPIHTGFDQIKNGSLAVDGFVSHGIASFDGSPTSVWFSGIIRGDSPLKKELASIVRIGGTDAITGTTYNTVAQATDEIRAAQRLYAQNIKNTYDGALCADAEGYVVLCSNATPSVTLQSIDFKNDTSCSAVLALSPEVANPIRNSRDLNDQSKNFYTVGVAGDYTYQGQPNGCGTVGGGGYDSSGDIDSGGTDQCGPGTRQVGYSSCNAVFTGADISRANQGSDGNFYVTGYGNSTTGGELRVAPATASYYSQSAPTICTPDDRTRISPTGIIAPYTQGYIIATGIPTCTMVEGN